MTINERLQPNSSVMLELASDFRAVLESLDWGCIGKSGEFPKGCCHYASGFLIDFLESRGVVGARLVRGHYEPDIDNAAHYWVEVSGLAIDVTADQFSFCDEPVIVQPASEWHEPNFSFARMDVDRTYHSSNPQLCALRISLEENLTRG
ncbi:MAG: hypothetical protein CL693_01100 [Cellvibrionaceae bacterium]|nr:hypothetical protein [Cellvibrionaceae bacterium]|tara:strand:- start:22783 stop:23229 length:447 start_codon:yes stop_codon:yes gene_type:complete